MLKWEPRVSALKASVDVQPKGFHVTIEPSTLIFSSAMNKQAFKLIGAPTCAICFTNKYQACGSLSWIDGEDVVRSHGRFIWTWSVASVVIKKSSASTKYRS
ncbi:hypothetical protein KC19_2G025400 [Ceratodon purpureus]|uniref:Subtilisin-like protease fibronectin type-III domain-containing protein n=1 Tax=Ceratodon purpureus TaxID=3225 RepID=A0A8T0IRE1_CERPU|nr:hypothetical protein KC19_2G025400 [Ceratodon purpureus]